MAALDVRKYGYPLRNGYGITTDLALQRTEVQSGWGRQRRTYLHNASLITLSWRLRVAQAKELREWLQSQPDGQFFDCELLTGNDAAVGNTITSLPVRRTTGITEQRVPLTDQVVLSFSAETQEQTGYQELADAAAGQGPVYYPGTFPLPASANFSAAHGTRNVTVYTLTYQVDTALLGDWLAFAGSSGTAWFWHPMISSNVLCGYELVRYTSAPSQQLTGPNSWSVGVSAETMPGYSILELVMPPTGECTYDSAINYDDPLEEYDCGGVAPPSGTFSVPASASVSATAIGAQPLTASAMIGFNRDGSVVSSPPSSPVWTAWHTAPETLPNAAVSFSKVVEFSIDGGVTWQYSSPRPGGTWLSLKAQDVWVRLAHTATYDEVKTLTLNVEFRTNQLPTPETYATAGCDLTLNLSLDVTDPIGVVDGAAFEDGYIITLGPGETTNGVSAGVTFNNQGQVFSRTSGGLIGEWFSPTQINAGQGLWIILTDAGGSLGQGKPTTGVRMSLAVSQVFEVYSAGAPGSTFARCYWSGTYQIYNAQSGGSLLGSGTIYLESEASQ